MADDLFYQVSVTAPGATYDLSSDLGSLTVEQRASQPAKVTIELNDPFKVFSHGLQEGMGLEVDLGTAEDHGVVFQGRIYQANASFPETGVPSLTLQAYDGTMAMGLKARNRVFQDMALSDIVFAVVGDYSFPVTLVDVVGDPSFPGNGIRQREETDLQFLLRLGAECGCAMASLPGDSGEELEFRAERILMEEEPEVILYYGRCDVEHRLLTFTPSSDVGQIQLPRVMSGIDYTTGERIDARPADDEDVEDLEDPFASENLSAFGDRYPDRADRLGELIDAAPAAHDEVETDLGTTTRAAVTTFTTPEDLAERLQNQFSSQRLGMHASGATPGNYRLRAQRTVGILDVGGHFSGKWFLTQVRHTVNRSGFRSEFECRR